MQKAVWALFLLFPFAAPAQSVITITPQQCVWHAGDNPAWAAQDLDESTWLPYSQWTPNPAQPHLWVRCHADLSSLQALTHPAIQVGLYSAYQIYLNGAPVGAEGNLRNGNSSINALQSYPVPSQLLQSGSATLALHITDRSTLSNSGPILGLVGSRLQLRAGDATLLDALRAHSVLARMSLNAGTAVTFGAIGVLALILLSLYFFDRSRIELLMLCISCLSLASLRINEFATASLFSYSLSTCLLVVILGNIGLTVTQIPFYFAIAHRRMPRAVLILLVTLALTYLPTAVDVLFAANQPPWISRWNLFFTRPFSLLVHTIVSLAPFFVFRPYTAIPRRIRPLALLCMLLGIVDFIWFSVESTILHLPGIPDLFARWGAALLNARGFTTACVLTALLALLFREQRQITEERAQFAGEVQAARSVQQYLIPDHLPPTPGLAIESVYRPARQVGGDFFQILPHNSDGSVLIVVGDVAGKGVEAGMLATLIVGAIRTAAAFTSDPVRILALLNERLRGRGLVTCLALRIEQDGSTALVNAGHLPPYLNGIELAVEGSLPLGAVPGINFPVARFQLAEGDSMILMTDGVAEAQNTQGQLFGFDRVGELLRVGTAGAGLAEAAQQFGQQDDITVLTLTRSTVQPALHLVTTGFEPVLDHVKP